MRLGHARLRRATGVLARGCGALVLIPCVALSCAADPSDSARTPHAAPATQSASADAAAPPATREAANNDKPEIDWAQLSKDLGHTGVLTDGVYTITVPRDDLDVTIEGMPVPTGAGIQSVFHFYRCACGKAIVVGEFVLADYEANDVIDTLRAGAGFKVSSLGPLLIHEHPRLMAVRFQAEGKAPELAKTLRETLSWTGKERMAPQSLPAAE